MLYSSTLASDTLQHVVSAGFTLPQTILKPDCKLAIAVLSAEYPSIIRLNYVRVGIVVTQIGAVVGHPTESVSVVNRVNSAHENIYLGVWEGLIQEQDTMNVEPLYSVDVYEENYALADFTSVSDFTNGAFTVAIVNNTTNVTYSVVAEGAPKIYTGWI